ncbi:MAG: biopolymer transporter ExbD [Kofleriaceae bacterium]
MNLGGGGGVKNDINVTPLIDVVLVLLIIFLVTMPIMMRTITLEVPRKIRPDEFVAPSESKPINILVKSDLTVSLDAGDGEKTVQATEVSSKLRELLASKKGDDKIVFVDFEDMVPWTNTVELMDAIRAVASDPDHNEVKVALKMKEDAPPP